MTIDQLQHYATQLLTVFGALVAVASTAAPFVKRDSRLGKWIAWVASCPIGHWPMREKPQ